MIAQVISDANVLMNGGGDKDIGDLHVRRRSEEGSVGERLVYQSTWRPTPNELRALNDGGDVLLTVLHFQPAVRVEVVRFDTDEVVP